MARRKPTLPSRITAERLDRVLADIPNDRAIIPQPARHPDYFKEWHDTIAGDPAVSRRLDRAKADREAYRSKVFVQEIVEPKPKKALPEAVIDAFYAEEVDVDLPSQFAYPADEAFDLIEPAKVSQKIGAGVIAILEGSERARAARHRIIQQRLPPAKAPPKRKSDIEKLSNKDGHTRQRLRAPFTMPQETANRLVVSLITQHEKTACEPPLRATRLDKALEGHEVDALARYLLDRSAELEGGQIANYGQRRGGSSAWDRSPLSERKRQALSRLSFVHKNLNAEDRSDLNEFTRMIVPIDDRPVKTPEELGRMIGKSSCSRVSEGVFVGAMRKIAQRLNNLLRLEHSSREIHAVFVHASFCRSLDVENAA